MQSVTVIIFLAAMLLMAACGNTPAYYAEKPQQSASMPKRQLNPTLGGRWIGNGIAYGAYRDGESPLRESLTSTEHILEDLLLIADRWNLIRLYDSGQQSRNILQVIRDNKLPLRVLQGAWISGEHTWDEDRAQLDQVIELANEFPGIIIAVNIGNEIFVDWSVHKMEDMDKVVEYIRFVRPRIQQPVTVIDDFNFWNKEHARKIAGEIDFIGMHAYAFWNNQPLERAMDWTDAVYRDIQGRYPDHLVVFTETGWPTSRIHDTDSYEGKLIGRAGEDEQKRFFEEYIAWVDENSIISFYFEAFDENWKGESDEEDAKARAEKHWGLYRADRTPKKALQ